MPELSEGNRAGKTVPWTEMFLVAMFAAFVPSTAVLVGGVVPGPVPARIIRVIDGDTFVVRAQIWLGQEVETRVRLDGVDTPELRGKCPEESRLGGQARDFVARLGGGLEPKVYLFGVDYGKFAGRVVARIETLEGIDYSLALIEAGLGRAYNGGRRQPWC